MTRRLLTLLFVFALVVAACSSDDTTDSETTTTAAASEDATTTTAAAAETTTTSGGDEAADAVTIRWRTRPDNDQETAVYQSISDSLQNQIGGVTLTYEAGGTETEGYQQALLTQLAAGEAPDVFWIPGANIADFASKGVILNLAPYAAADPDFSADDFYPGPMAQLTTDPATGQPSSDYLWGLPRDVSAFALYLNLDLINEAGAADPRELAEAGTWDWAAFTEVATAVSDLGSEISGYGQSSWWGPLGWWLYSAGGGFFNDAVDACGLDTAESIAGLTAFRDFYATGAGLTYGEDPEPVFKAGNLGMFQNGRWATPGIREVDFNWDVVKLPVGPGGPSNWQFWGAYVVNANTENPEAAWKLVSALTSAEVQSQVSELGANIPSRVSQDALDAFLTFSPPENNQAFLDGLSENPVTEAPLWNGDWPSYSGDMTTAVNAVVTGDTTIEEYEANICAELNQYFDS
jgi:multiple sugar transport system substrate-binding protein